MVVSGSLNGTHHFFFGGKSKLMLKMYDKVILRDFPYDLGWCHIMSPVVSKTPEPFI